MGESIKIEADSSGKNEENEQITVLKHTKGENDFIKRVVERKKEKAIDPPIPSKGYTTNVGNTDTIGTVVFVGEDVAGEEGYKGHVLKEKIVESKNKSWWKGLWGNN